MTFDEWITEQPMAARINAARYYQYGNYAKEAALDLMLEIGLARKADMIDRDGVVDWERALDNEYLWSSGEMRVTKFAASLAGVEIPGFSLQDCLYGVDNAWRAMMQRAFNHAFGQRPQDYVVPADPYLIYRSTHA